MNEVFLTIFFISLLLFLLGSGVWVALSMIAVSAIGMMLFTTRPVGDAMATTIWGTSSSWTLTALPLFVWMGEILFRTKLSENLFKGLSPWLSKLPGGLIHVNVVGCGVECVEFHMGKYCKLFYEDKAQAEIEFKKIHDLSIFAYESGLEVHLGHGLDFDTTKKVTDIPCLQEVNIGFFLIADSIFSGLENSIRKMKDICNRDF